MSGLARAYHVVMDRNTHPDALRAFLVANFIQQQFKHRGAGRYEKIEPGQVTELVDLFSVWAEDLSERILAGWLDPKKGVSKEIEKLRRDQFEWKSFKANELGPPLWVGGVPHEYSHGTTADLLRFVSIEGNSPLALGFFHRVRSIRSLPALLELPAMVIAPASREREAHGDHGEKGSDEGPTCLAGPITPCAAYVEDGNHRTVARFLNEDAGASLEFILYTPA